ncbi:hypothetical protein L0Y69_01010 [bacterium]|nr:hypothetical protein [bacterium]
MEQRIPIKNKSPAQTASEVMQADMDRISSGELPAFGEEIGIDANENISGSDKARIKTAAGLFASAEEGQTAVSAPTIAAPPPPKPDQPPVETAEKKREDYEMTPDEWETERKVGRVMDVPFETVIQRAYIVGDRDKIPPENLEHFKGAHWIEPKVSTTEPPPVEPPPPPIATEPTPPTTEAVETSGEVAGNAEKEYKGAEAQLRDTAIETPEGLQVKFSDLSEGKQALVLDYLKQSMVERAKEGALAGYREEKQEGGFFKKLWLSIGKSGHILKREQELKEDLFDGKVDQTEVIQNLIRMAHEGPEAEMKNGKIEMQYADEKEFDKDKKEISDQDRVMMYKFNETASTFSRISHAWGEKGAEKGNKESFERTKVEYEKNRADMLVLFEKKYGTKDALERVKNIDQKVTLNQLLNTHPELEKEIQQIDDKSAWMSGTKEVLKQRGMYFAYGAVARTAAGALLSVMSAPVLAASPFVGGLLGRMRAKEMAEMELEERETLAKAGIGDKSAEAKNINDAESLAVKLSLAIEKVQNAPEADNGGKQKLIRSLQSRIAYTKGKLDDGNVNFGNADQKIGKKYELMRSLGEALAIDGMSHDTRLQERLDRHLHLNERKIDDAQKAFIKERAKKGMYWGAVFAGAGAVMADVLHGEGSVTKTGAAKLWDRSAEALNISAGKLGRPLTLEEIPKLAGTNGKEAGAMIAELKAKSPEVPGIQSTDGAMSKATLQKINATHAAAGVEPTKAVSGNMNGFIEKQYSGADEGKTFVTRSSMVNEGPVIPAVSVKSGDNLTNILKTGLLEKIGGGNLTDAQKENFVQNLLNTKNSFDTSIAGQVKKIFEAHGISDMNQIKAGQKIPLDEIYKEIGEEKLKGLVDHARGISGTEIEKNISTEATGGETGKGGGEVLREGVQWRHTPYMDKIFNGTDLERYRTNSPTSWEHMQKALMGEKSRLTAYAEYLRSDHGKKLQDISIEDFLGGKHNYHLVLPLEGKGRMSPAELEDIIRKMVTAQEQGPLDMKLLYDKQTTIGDLLVGTNELLKDGAVSNPTSAEFKVTIPPHTGNIEPQRAHDVDDWTTPKKSVSDEMMEKRPFGEAVHLNADAVAHAEEGIRKLHTLSPSGKFFNKAVPEWQYFGNLKIDELINGKEPPPPGLSSDAQTVLRDIVRALDESGDPTLAIASHRDQTLYQYLKNAQVLGEDIMRGKI